MNNKMDKQKETIGEIVKNARLKQSLSQGEVARKASIQQSYLSQIESNKGRPPTIYVIEKIALALNLDRNRLIKLLEIKRIEYEQWRLDEKRQEKGIKKIESSDFRLVPVLNSISAGQLIEFGDQEYPVGWADDWEYCPPEIKDQGVYSLDIEGDSMEPKISNGDRVLISPNSDIENGQIVAVADEEGKQVLKRIHYRKKDIILTSDNPKYQPIFLEVKDKPKILGKVVRIIKRP